MADEVSNGVSLSGARRSLYENSAHRMRVLRDADLFRVGRFAE